MLQIKNITTQNKIRVVECREVLRILVAF